LDIRVRRWPGARQRLHNEEFYNFYTPRSVIKMIKTRRMRWVGHVTRMGSVGKSEVKGPLGRPKLCWDDNIRMDLKHIVRV